MYTFPPSVLRADWNWYSSNRISFMDSWMEVKLKYGSVMMMLVSVKSTCRRRQKDPLAPWLQPPPRKNTKSLQRQRNNVENLEHLFSKQMIPDFPLNVPVDQVTLEHTEGWKCHNCSNTDSQPLSHSPSECRQRAPRWTMGNWLISLSVCLCCKTIKHSSKGDGDVCVFF